MAQPASCRILFVDDNPDIRTVLSIGLEQFGYRVICAHDATSALEALVQHTFDLVIVDQGLPEMRGIELGKLICKQMASPPGLVLFTGTISKELEAEAKQAGFADCWIKPLGLNSLLRRIEGLLID